MKTIKIKTLKKVLKDAKESGIKEVEIVSIENKRLDILEISVSPVTGVRIKLK